ncbi:MAG: hypothetical protein AAFP04_02955, partial [Myxococcota bacterium]
TYAVVEYVLEPDSGPVTLYLHRSADGENGVNLPKIHGASFERLWKNVLPPDPVIKLDSPEEIQIWGAEMLWSKPVPRDLLLAVADDEERVVFLSDTTKQVFAPYDGGADVILRDESEASDFRARFKKWLSPRADGL